MCSSDLLSPSRGVVPQQAELEVVPRVPNSSPCSICHSEDTPRSVLAVPVPEEVELGEVLVEGEDHLPALQLLLHQDVEGGGQARGGVPQGPLDNDVFAGLQLVIGD